MERKSVLVTKIISFQVCFVQLITYTSYIFFYLLWIRNRSDPKEKFRNFYRDNRNQYQSYFYCFYLIGQKIIHIIIIKTRFNSIFSKYFHIMNIQTPQTMDIEIDFDSEEELLVLVTPILVRRDANIFEANINTPCEQILTITEISKKIYYQPECPICLQFLSNEEAVPLKCGHVFCERDIKEILRVNSRVRCPLCRGVQQVQSINELRDVRKKTIVF